ncbi:PREDICTED: mitochondrial import inner membrane translocase subunit tim16-like [Amphimedon queenslandica]|nr:PREDICTED: mitochondrial import inner membrane translocase subunit tim16-like [Amphimedon queenslandica]|eukprot:XP_003388058.1 PREDICTED: mitochondrial import inner membrane translocase subunit tim16-like [Amphimedon queenslandica]
MARFLAQIIVLGGQAVARAFTQALKQEYQATAAARKAATEAGRDANKAAKASTYTGLSLQEAKSILSVDDLENLEAIRKNYEHLFKANDKSQGGSFYLQSKVVRAKERIEYEIDQEIFVDKITDGTNSESEEKQ